MSPRAVADVKSLLAEASPRGRALYALVRSLLGEFDEAAPWSLLYAPPADAGELVVRLGTLLGAVERVPARVSAELALLADRAASDEEQAEHGALAEAEFYFATLHQMTAADQRRLRAALDRLSADAPLVRADADQLCELAADLKGKYASAIMGAAAALVGEGRFRGVEFEAQLFPEKAEEAERNRRLLAALEAVQRALRAVVASFPWRPVLASWRRQRPLDRYALGDLVSLRAHLLRLLTVANRRALYSGDYQQLRGRETLLGERLRALEELHLRSLEMAPESAPEAARALFAHLERKLLEVAALLDVEVLRAEIGSGRIAALRAGRERPPALAAPADDAALAAAVGEEDLKTFVDLLVGAVRKRASIALRSAEPAAPATAAEPEPELELLAPAAARPRGAGPQLDARASRELGARLAGTLARLTAAESPRWRAFQMVHKLQARLGALPPALWSESAPLLSELDGDLLPILDQAAAAGAVPGAAVETLRAAVGRLRERDPALPAIAAESGADLARIVRLLESLQAAATALAAAR